MRILDNKICDPGAQAFCDALKLNTTITNQGPKHEDYVHYFIQDNPCANALKVAIETELKNNRGTIN